MSDVYTKSLLDYYSHLNGLSVNDPKYSDQAAQEAQEKYENYINSLKGGIPQDAQSTVDHFLDVFQHPQRDIETNILPLSGINSWAKMAGNEDVASQIEFGAFTNENATSDEWSDDALMVNPLTASFFALCGLKTWDNQKGPYKTDVPSTSVFQSIINKFQGGMSQDDLNFTLGNLGSAADQEKLVSAHRKIQPLLKFANHMVSIINSMISYCQQVGLGSGNNPCWDICYQYEATNVPPDQRGADWNVAADASWSRSQLAEERKKLVLNDFGISGSDLPNQLKDFFNDFNNL
jgi:hypothetical protein